MAFIPLTEFESVWQSSIKTASEAAGVFLKNSFSIPGTFGAEKSLILQLPQHNKINDAEIMFFTMPAAFLPSYIFHPSDSDMAMAGKK